MPKQLEFFTIPSPCRGICQSDSRGYCLGCYRSRQERFDWGNMDDTARREVLRLCHQRYLRLRRADKRAEDASSGPDQPSLF